MASSAPVKALPILVGALDESRAPDLVVGRDELVRRLWDAVRERCLCVTGARHMGKTWALKLAAATHPVWVSPVLLDAGACQTVPELVWRLAQRLGRAGIVPRDWYGRVDQWYSKLGVASTDGTPAAPWTMVLNGTLQHASVYTGATVPAVVLDGFGAFVQRVCQAGAHDTVRRLIDAVAAFPADWPRLRCVISGSSELDDALRTVYGETSRSALRTAFATFEVPPLNHDDAQYLAACLLKGESVLCSDLQEVAEAVATTTGENPFLIHNTIDWMARFQPGVWTPERVRDVPTVLWIESTDSDDSGATDEPLGAIGADDALVRAADVLHTLAQPAPTPPPETPRERQANPVLTLPPAFVLFKEQQAGATAPPPRTPHRAEASVLTRMWRRVQSLAQTKSFAATHPALFFVTHEEPGQRDGQPADPPSFVALTPRGPAVAGMQALAEARRALLDLEDSAPLLGIESDHMLFDRGCAHIQRGRFDAALDMFQEIARRARPGDCAEMASSALQNTAYVLARLRRFDEAIGVNDALVRQYGEDGRADVLACVAMGLVNKGACLIALGRSKDALEVCRALLACSPPDIDSVFSEAIVSAQFNVAFALAQLGKDDDALTAYLAVAETCCASSTAGMRSLAADAHYNAAVLHMNKDRRFETIEACEAAIARDPHHVRAHALRTVSYVQLHLVGEAIAALTDAYAAFAPDTLPRALLVASLLKEATNSAGLMPMLVPALKSDPGALATGIVLWLRRAMPIDSESAPRIAAAESALRPLCERDSTALSALDAVRAARYAALGNLAPLESLPEDFRPYLR